MGSGFLGKGVWATHDQEFEGLDMGEFSGGMDSPDFSGAGSACAGTTDVGGFRG